MAFDTFVPPANPSLQTTRGVKPRINVAQFGDGYSQRSQDGLNAAPRSYSAVWEALLSTDADTIEAFFEAHMVTPFLWTPPLETIQRKWLPTDWSRGYLGGSSVSLTATLAEQFDL